MGITVDYRGLSKFKENLEDIKTKGLDEFFTQMTRSIAAQLLRQLVQNTPVDTGYLREMWNVANNVSAHVERHGDTYEITLYNPTEYASYVNDGHRIRGKDDAWVLGHFFVEDSLEAVEKRAPAAIRRKLDKYLKGVFG